jgi:hypothetical protein
MSMLKSWVFDAKIRIILFRFAFITPECSSFPSSVLDLVSNPNPQGDPPSLPSPLFPIQNHLERPIKATRSLARSQIKMQKKSYHITVQFHPALCNESLDIVVTLLWNLQKRNCR